MSGLAVQTMLLANPRYGFLGFCSWYVVLQCGFFCKACFACKSDGASQSIYLDVASNIKVLQDLLASPITNLAQK